MTYNCSAHEKIAQLNPEFKFCPACGYEFPTHIEKFEELAIIIEEAFIRWEDLKTLNPKPIGRWKYIAQTVLRYFKDP